MTNLILRRGLPGSGKTTLAQSLGGVVLPADDYFYRPSQGGWQYCFYPAQLKAAHAQCIRNTEIALRWKLPVVIVTNTFTQQWEMQPYFDMAQRHGAFCHSLIVENRHGGTSVHSVPDAVIGAMRKRFEIQL